VEVGLEAREHKRRFVFGRAGGMVGCDGGVPALLCTILVPDCIKDMPFESWYSR
jgi:hypothetical protein